MGSHRLGIAAGYGHRDHIAVHQVSCCGSHRFPVSVNTVFRILPVQGYAAGRNRQGSLSIGNIIVCTAEACGNNLIGSHIAELCIIVSIGHSAAQDICILPVHKAAVFHSAGSRRFAVCNGVVLCLHRKGSFGNGQRSRCIGNIVVARHGSAVLLNYGASRCQGIVPHIFSRAGQCDALQGSSKQITGYGHIRNILRDGSAV